MSLLLSVKLAEAKICQDESFHRLSVGAIEGAGPISS